MPAARSSGQGSHLTICSSPYTPASDIILVPEPLSSTHATSPYSPWRATVSSRTGAEVDARTTDSEDRAAVIPAGASFGGCWIGESWLIVILASWAADDFDGKVVEDA